MGRFIRPVVIPSHHGITARLADTDQKLSGLARFHGIAGIVHNPHFHARRRPADRGRMIELLFVGQRRHTAYFGHGEERHQPHIRKKREELTLELDRKRFASDDDTL